MKYCVRKVQNLGTLKTCYKSLFFKIYKPQYLLCIFIIVKFNKILSSIPFMCIHIFIHSPCYKYIHVMSNYFFYHQINKY